MGIFVCDCCDAIDNTALGAYNCRSRHKKWFGIENGTALCTICMPAVFQDGSKNSKKPEGWHNCFPLRYFADHPDTIVLNRPVGDKPLSTYVCDECGVLENTALGNWHVRDRNMRFFGIENGKALCSQCTPATYLSGGDVSNGGQWHNRFPRRMYKDHPNVPVINRQPVEE